MKRAVVGLCLLAACKTAEPAPTPAPAPAPAPAAPAPAKPAGTPDAPFRAQPPPPGAPVAFHAPQPKELKLKNGLPVYLIERPGVPLVSVVLALRSGEDTEPKGKAGLASFTLDLLDEGTKSKDAAAIARGFEDLGARYQSAADADASALSVTALSETLPQALELFSDVALNPAFRDADVERLRSQRLGQIAQQLDDPAQVGEHVLSRVVFGESHPWAFPGEGTAKSVQSLKAADLKAWHAANFTPQNAALFVVGDTTAAAVQPLLEARFGAWKGKGGKPAELKAPAGGKRTAVYVVDKPDAPQSQIWVGELGVAAGAPDVFPVRVMNNILGGSFNSRLNGNLRSEHAYSYGAYSWYATHRAAGPFFAAAGVVADKTAEALGEFMKELERMKQGQVTDAELADAKASLVQAIPALFASNEATANAFARAWQHGLPSDYYAQYQSRVQSVTAADVAKAAQQHLHPDQVAVVVVGPLKSISDKVGALGLGKVELRDAEGEAAKAAKASK